MPSIADVEQGIKDAPKAGNRVKDKQSARKTKAQAGIIDDLETHRKLAEELNQKVGKGLAGLQKDLEGNDVPVTVQAEHKTAYLYESKRLKLRISEEDKDWASAAALVEVVQMVREKVKVKKDMAINGFEWERECDQIATGIKGAAI